MVFTKAGYFTQIVAGFFLFLKTMNLYEFLNFEGAQKVNY